MALTIEEQRLVMTVSGRQDVEQLTQALNAEENTLRELISAKQAGLVSDATYESQIKRTTTAMIANKEALDKARVAVGGYQQNITAAGYAMNDFFSVSGGIDQRLNAMANNLPGVFAGFGGLGLALGAVVPIAAALIKNWDALMAALGGGSSEIPKSADALKLVSGELEKVNKKLEEYQKKQNLTNWEVRDYNKLSAEQVILERQKNAEAERRQTLSDLEHGVSKERRERASGFRDAAAEVHDPTGLVRQAIENLNPEMGRADAQKKAEDLMLDGAKGFKDSIEQIRMLIRTGLGEKDQKFANEIQGSTPEARKAREIGEAKQKAEADAKEENDRLVEELNNQGIEGTARWQAEVEKNRAALSKYTKVYKDGESPLNAKPSFQIIPGSEKPGIKPGAKANKPLTHADAENALLGNVARQITQESDGEIRGADAIQQAQQRIEFQRKMLEAQSHQGFHSVAPTGPDAGAGKRQLRMVLPSALTGQGAAHGRGTGRRRRITPDLQPGSRQIQATNPSAHQRDRDAQTSRMIGAAGADAQRRSKARAAGTQASRALAAKEAARHARDRKAVKRAIAEQDARQAARQAATGGAVKRAVTEQDARLQSRQSDTQAAINRFDGVGPSAPGDHGAAQMVGAGADATKAGQMAVAEALATVGALVQKSNQNEQLAARNIAMARQLRGAIKGIR